MTSSQSTPRIVVGVDGSVHSKLALRWAARIAATEGATIDVVAAWEFPNTYGWSAFSEEYSPQADIEKALNQAIDEVFGVDRPQGLRTHVVEGRAAMALLDASKDALMLVVGSRGHGGFVGLLLGSVSAKVAEHATCPVLVVHAPAPERAS